MLLYMDHFFFVYETFMLSKGYTTALANRVCTWYKGNVVLIYELKVNNDESST